MVDSDNMAVRLVQNRAAWKLSIAIFVQMWDCEGLS